MINALNWLYYTAQVFLGINDYQPNTEKFYEVEESKSYERVEYSVKDYSSYVHKVMGHYYKADNRKLAYVVHGYNDNCGYTKPIHKFFLKNGYDVLCIEMPGHGLSSGKRADIKRFSIYGEVYEELFKRIPKNYDYYQYYSHSTGSVGMIQLLLQEKSIPFDNVIFGAPLIRSYRWDMSRKLMGLLDPVINYFPVRRPSIVRDYYRELMIYDPSLNQWLPKNWFYQLQNWNNELIESAEKSSFPIKVIFAENDGVIDTEYNHRFLKSRFENASFHILNDSGHVFHNEIDKVRDNFFKELKGLL